MAALWSLCISLYCSLLLFLCLLCSQSGTVEPGMEKGEQSALIKEMPGPCTHEIHPKGDTEIS